MNLFHILGRTVQKWKKAHWAHNPIITIELTAKNLIDNINILRGMAPTWEIAPVLKSNAYGHDLISVAKILTKTNPAFLCVDSYPEAEILRKTGIQTPILIMGYTPAKTMQASNLKKVDFLISSVEQLYEISPLNISIHIKFDTGMHRRGIKPEQLPEVLKNIQNAKYKVSGIMSHFSESEKASEVTMKQIEVWNYLASECKKSLPKVKYFHMANSGGFAYHSKIYANVGRMGIAMYGINPGNIVENLKPVLAMKSIISEINVLREGQKIGYGGTFTAPHDMRVATIPVGYFEGLDKRLSNKGFVTFDKTALPIVGKISMNMSCCDVGQNSDISIGDTVTLISNDSKDQNSIENHAKICETGPYEILVGIPAGLRRVII